jgi:hypothetical protein
MKQINTYQCDWCSKQGVIEVLELHEPNCMLNPDHKACSSCVHEDVEYWDGNPWFSCKLKKESSDYDVDGGCPSHKVKGNYDT